eukprot:848326-Pelagomonas_calceolata.AAC.1
MHSIHIPTQANILPSNQNINPENNDTLNIPTGDGSTISDNLPGIQSENSKDGPPSKRTRSTKTVQKQDPRNTFQQCSQDTSGPSVNQRNNLPETLQIFPQTEEVLATRSKEPNSEPPRKRKHSRYRASITPHVHLIHYLLLNRTQSNALTPSPDVNPEVRNAFNIPLGDAPSTRDNLPDLQTELPEDRPPSESTRSTRRHVTASRSMPQQCSQGILGSSANHNDTGCTHTEPDHLYTACTLVMSANALTTGNA